MPRGITTTSVFIAALCIAASALLILAIPVLWSVLATAGVVAMAAFMIIGVRGGKM
jgi:hypothetical protein